MERINHRSGTKIRAAIGASILLVALFAATLAHGAAGDLSQKPAPAGCVGVGAGGCAAATAMSQPRQVAISADGESAYVTTSGSDSIVIFDRDPASGALDQKDGVDGCISETGTGGACQEGDGLDAAQGIAISPDQRSVYVAAFGSDSIAVFDRDPATGQLDQKAGLATCVSEDGTSGDCTDGVALDSVGNVEVSPDGEHVYAGASISDAITVFDRDTTGTATHGALTQKSGEAACISEAPVVGAPCEDGKALAGVSKLAMSADGATLYAASNDSDAIVILDRDPASGEIAQKPGTLGCISESGTAGACQNGIQIGAAEIELSPDQTSLYTASTAGDGIGVFDRNTANGRLTQRTGTDACVSLTGTGGQCQTGFLLDGLDGLVVSPDGTSVYGAAQLSNAVTSFDRASNGALTQGTGPGACVSEDGSAGICADGVGLGGLLSLTTSPEGNSLYGPSLSTFSIAILDVEPFTEPPPVPQAPAAGDTAAPDTQITAGPKKKEKKKQATFEFTSTEAGSTFQCKLDDGGFETCTSPEDVRAGKGKHTFEVRARDAAGNVDPTPAVQKWAVKKKKK